MVPDMPDIGEAEAYAADRHRIECASRLRLLQINP
jgi:hypothetical protein